MKKLTILIIITGLTLFSYSCATLGEAFGEFTSDLESGFDVGDVDISSEDVAAIADSAKDVVKSFEDITPEQEYYIGRAVGAVVLNQYAVYEDQAATDYLNLLGQTLAMASDRPELFGGYHFLILDSDEINAFASPSGLIFISRGMIRLTENEDMLAAVLAHEIGHIVNRHGLKAIKQTRITSALGKVAQTAADTVDDGLLADLTGEFTDSINDIAQTMITSGYSKANEYDADKTAVAILNRVGYDPAALLDLLEEMEKYLEPGRKDFSTTHPPTEDRIKLAKVYTRRNRAEPYPGQRRVRYKTALAGI